MVITDRRRTGVKTVLPKLLLKFSVIVLVVLLAGSLYTYYQVDNKVHIAQEQSIRAMATGSVAGISDMIVLRDYSHIQQTLEQLMANKAIVDVAVSDTSGKILSQIVRTDKGTMPVFEDTRLQPPTTSDDVTWSKNTSNNTITVWAKIDSSYHIGWIKIELSTQAEDNLLDNLNSTLMLTFVAMVIVLSILVGAEFKKTYNVLNLHEKNIYHVAHHDTLTKLPNRLSLEPTLQQMMINSDKHRTPLAVTFLDLDGFKEINDTHGHAAGDKVLIQVGIRLKEMLRLDDAIIRVGGDEFVLLLNAIAPQDVEALLKRVITTINGTYEIMIGGERLRLNVGASIGVTNYPIDRGSPADLIAHADAAMYSAKQAGRNRVAFYDPAMLVDANKSLDI